MHVWQAASQVPLQPSLAPPHLSVQFGTHGVVTHRPPRQVFPPVQQAFLPLPHRGWPSLHFLPSAVTRPPAPCFFLAPASPTPTATRIPPRAAPVSVRTT